VLNSNLHVQCSVLQYLQACKLVHACFLSAVCDCPMPLSVVIKPHATASQVKHIHAHLHRLHLSMSCPHRLAHSSSSHLAKLLMFKFHAKDLWITHPCCQTMTYASPCQSSLAQRQTLPNTFPITLIPPLYVSALLLCYIIPAFFLPPLLSSCVTVRSLCLSVV